MQVRGRSGPSGVARGSAPRRSARPDRGGSSTAVNAARSPSGPRSRSATKSSSGSAELVEQRAASRRPDGTRTAPRTASARRAVPACGCGRRSCARGRRAGRPRPSSRSKPASAWARVGCTWIDSACSAARILSRNGSAPARRLSAERRSVAAVVRRAPGDGSPGCAPNHSSAAGRPSGSRAEQLLDQRRSSPSRSGAARRRSRRPSGSARRLGHAAVEVRLEVDHPRGRDGAAHPRLGVVDRAGDVGERRAGAASRSSRRPAAPPGRGASCAGG